MRVQEITLNVPGGAGKAEAMVNDPDETLMLRVQTGDHTACRELVNRHLGRIVAFAGRVLGDRILAEDVAQEVFLRLWSHAQQWRPSGARLTTWLHRIAMNLCLDNLARRRETPLDKVEDPVDPKPDAATLLQERNLSREVEKALGELPDSQRIAITLCYYQGLRNREAAETMDVSVEALGLTNGTVKRHLFHATRRLQYDLSE